MTSRGTSPRFGAGGQVNIERMKRAPIAFFLLSGLLCAASCSVPKTYTSPEGPVYEGAYSCETRRTAGKVTVVSYNIALGERIDLAVAEFRGAPALRCADIVLLQEMHPEAVRAMAESLGYDYVYYPSVVHVKHGKDFGTAVLTRWPIVSHRKLLLPYEDPVRGSRRAITVAEVAVGAYEVLVASVHTETAWMNIDKRVAQADSLIRSLTAGRPYAVIGGDFNTFSWEAVEALDAMFERAGFVCATAGVGYTAAWGPLSLFEFEMDHIYVRGFDVVDRGKVWDARASDHKPVWAVLRPRAAGVAPSPEE